MNPQNSRRLRGRLHTTDDQEPPPELQIEAFQKTLTGADRRLGTAQCDPEGHFEIDQGPSADPTQESDRRPEVYFCVWHGEHCVLNTKDEPCTPDPSEEVQIDLPDNAIGTAQEASEGSATFSVRGRVVHPDGRAASDLVVLAFAVDGTEATDEVNLNEDVTDDEGQYCIPYQGQGDPTNGNEPPDLRVRAYEPGEAGQGDPVATSPIVVSPGRHQVVDLVVGDEPYRGPAEFDRIKATLDPLLENGDLDPSPDRVSYLATKTGLTEDRITDYLQSRRLEDQSDAPAPAFYALLREGMPRELTALSVVNPDTHQRMISRAADTNVVSQSTVEQVDELTEALQDSAIDRLLSAPPDAEGPTLKPALDLIDLSEGNQRTLLERYRNHDGSVEAFWSDLQDEDEWGSDRVERIQTALQVGVLTQYDGDAAAVLMDEFAEEDEPLRAMARLDADALTNLLESHGVPDDGDDTDAGTHARRITRLLEDAFPGWVLAHRLDEDDFDLAGEVAGFFEDHPEVDLRSTRVDSYLAENGEDISNELRDSLRSVQRVFNVAPRHDKSQAMRTLLADDVDSAHAIQRIGKAAFLRRYKGELGDGQTEQIYAQARSMTAITQNLYAHHTSQRNGPSTYAIDGPPEANENSDRVADGGIPELEELELFRSLELCECEQCRSIYSPAAYLVDLLAWLKERRPDGEMLDVLTERRPDIVKTDLTCENTNTTLPYVDLVNEVLEEEVAPNGETPQTEWDAEKLRVQPEHLNPAAYDELADAYYPWSLPFNLWLEEARTYLGHLDVPRAQLIEQLGDPDAESMSSRVASERLGLTERDWNIVAGETSVDVWELWGWDSYTAGGGWKTSLDTVSTLLDHADLTYDELEDLLRSRYLNPEGDIDIDFEAPDCDLDNASLLNRPESGFFAQMHRFVRLMRRLDWTPRQMDTALATIPPHQPSASFLVRLGEVTDIRERTGTDLDEVLSWFGIPADGDGDGRILDTHDWGEEPSFYARLFQDETVPNPTDANFDPEDIADGSQSIDDHVPSIQAALEVTAEEIDLLITTQLADDHDLSLENLYKLYRVVSLAKAVDFPVRDLVVLLELSGRDPFDSSSPDELSDFLNEVDRVRRSDFDVAELDYFFRHQRRPGSPVAALDDAVGRTLTDLRDELTALKSDYRIVAEKPLEEQTANALSTLLSEGDVDRAIALIDPSSAEERAELTAFIDDRSELVNFIESQFETFLDPDEAKDKLLPVDEDAEVEDRYRYVLGRLFDHLLRTNREDLVVQGLSETLGADPSVLSTLLRDVLSSLSDSDDPAVEDFLTLPFLETTADPLGPDDADARDAFAQFRRLEKITRLMEGFDVPEGDVRWLIEHGPDFGLIDYRALPVTTDGDDVVAQFEAWLQTSRLVELRSVFAKGEGGILRMLEAVRTGESEEDLHSLVHKLTGWPEDDVAFLLSPDGFATTFPDAADLEASLPLLYRLFRAFDVLNKLGVSAETAVQWAREDPSSDQPDQAREIKQSVRARYDEDAWLDIAVPLRDDLRDKQREALVAYLVDDLKGIEDVEDLFGHFLLDVEMTSCMLTSRIKQAIASVQLFVQRCRMNLEPECELTEDDVREWESWRKKYRLWEANRKVFFNAENYTEPELRLDKSPFFEDQEIELLQAEISDENVEQAYLNYLEKLDDVARLEIAGCHIETKEGESDTIHVVGRTRDTPNRYFYRRLEDGSRWTPWEPVDADIEGDHVLPIVFNRRLRIIWPMFIPKAVEDEDPTDEASTPNQYWEIKLAWSELRNGKWTPKRITDATLETEDRYDKSEIWFDTAIRDGRLEVEVWHYSSKWSVRGIGRFAFTGAGDQVVKDESSGRYPFGTAENWDIQWGTEIWNNRYRKRLGSGWNNLELYAPTTIKDGSFSGWESTPVLDDTSGRFELVPPHQNRYRSQVPVFFQDEDRAFFVEPDNFGVVLPEEFGSGSAWKNPERVRLETYHQVDESLWGEPAIDSMPLQPNGVGEDAIVVGGEDAPVSPFGPGDVGGAISTEGVTEGRSSDTESRTMPLTASDATTTSRPAPSYAIDTEAGGRSTFDTSGGFQTMSYTGQITGYGGAVPTSEVTTNYRFSTFYHPYVGRFIQQLNRYGIEGFLDPSASQDTFGLARQLKEERYFDDTYAPTNSVEEPYPSDNIDFDPRGAYSLYNWELFFHAPMLIAKQLTRNQKFQEAQEWLHYIFNPTDSSDHPVPERFWNIKPFHQHPGGLSINGLLQRLTRDDPDPMVERWKNNPYEPHVIARLNHSIYQRYVVMQYCDNLIAWGDELLRRGSLEDRNEATQIYLLAREILGERPETVSPPDDDRAIRMDGDPETFEELEGYLDARTTAIEELETPIGPIGKTPAEAGDGPDPHFDYVPYFCIPRNDKLLEYWDTVDDRLFKIRHCLNIEGEFELPPLFEPPIDPDVLVEARAAGVDPSSVLSDRNAPLPNYRLPSMVPVTRGVVNECKSLGSSLLEALEKRDAEKLDLIRSNQETSVLEAAKEVRELRVEEVENSVEALKRSRELAEERRDYYQSREYMNSREKQHERSLKTAWTFQDISQVIKQTAGTFAAIPEFDVGSAGISSPLVKARFGGSNLSAATNAASGTAQLASSVAQQTATMAQIKGRYDRRQDDWEFQAEQAIKQIEKIEKEIAATEIRLEIAKNELENHELRIENSEEISTFMEEKFTNQELYNWMVGQTSSVYYQTYQLAYDLCKECERAYQRELADWDASFVDFGHWEGLRKGLLAGERLAKDLNKMEAAYRKQNKREHELTKHISLSMLDPVAVEMLKQTGVCHFRVPEALFDIDHPGHYMRRIKTVSLSIPCVTGPYTNVPAELTLLNSEIRTDPDPGGDEGYTRTEDDERFRDILGTAESIVTSSANRDSGLFETNLQDERYLPFEGAGAVSTWRIELPTELRPFDYDTITDGILHMRITAREGPPQFKNAARDQLRSSLNEITRPDTRTGLFEAVSLASEAPDAWHQLSTPSGDTVTEVDMGSDQFPAIFRDEGIEINEVVLLMEPREAVSDEIDETDEVTVNVTLTDGSTTEIILTPSERLTGLLESPPTDLAVEPGDWEIEISDIPAPLADNGGQLDPEKVEDIVIVPGYQIDE